MFSLRPDVIQLYGILTVTAFDTKDGRLFRHTKKNQVTDLGREVVLGLLLQDPAGDVYQQNPEYNQIWSLSVGDGTTPPSRDDTGLDNLLWTSVIARATDYTITYSPQWEIKISKVVPAGTLTGSNISEVGLFTRGDNDVPGLASNKRLYARQVHAVVPKTPTMIIEYEWRLGVTVQI